MNAESKKILNKIWAEDAPQNRIEPETLGIDRSKGWTIEYEQNKFPERKVWNQLICEIQSTLKDNLTYGIVPWDKDVEYPEYSFTQHSSNIYYSTEAVSKNEEAPNVNSKWKKF